MASFLFTFLDYNLLDYFFELSFCFVRNLECLKMVFFELWFCFVRNLECLKMASNLIRSLAKFRIQRSVCTPLEPGKHSGNDPPGKDFGLWFPIHHHKDLEQCLAHSIHSIYMSFINDLVTHIAEKKLQSQSDYLPPSLEAFRVFFLFLKF